jgi:TetR/AcrR family transcriptional regulator, mexJK operon transcriptional repressor
MSDKGAVMKMTESRDRTAHGGRPNSAQSERIGVAILTAARESFASVGYARTSMDQVAADAGVTKRTVYSRYGDKAGVFAAVIQKLGHTRLDEIDAIEVPEGSPRDVLMALADKLIELSLCPEIITLERMAVDKSQEFPALLRAREGLSQRLIEITVRHLEKIQRGDPPPGQLRRDAVIFLSMIFLPNMHRAIIRWEKWTSNDEAHFARAVDIFLHGYA